MTVTINGQTFTGTPSSYKSENILFITKSNLSDDVEYEFENNYLDYFGKGISKLGSIDIYWSKPITFPVLRKASSGGNNVSVKIAVKSSAAGTQSLSSFEDLGISRYTFNDEDISHSSQAQIKLRSTQATGALPVTGYYYQIEFYINNITSIKVNDNNTLKVYDLDNNLIIQCNCYSTSTSLKTIQNNSLTTSDIITLS